MGRTRENQGIYSLNSWEKGAIRTTVAVGTKDEHHSDYKIESSSMFLNGYNSKRSALHDLNLADPVS